MLHGWGYHLKELQGGGVAARESSARADVQMAVVVGHLYVNLAVLLIDVAGERLVYGVEVARILTDIFTRGCVLDARVDGQSRLLHLTLIQLPNDVVALNADLVARIAGCHQLGLHTVVGAEARLGVLGEQGVVFLVFRSLVDQHHLGAVGEFVGSGDARGLVVVDLVDERLGIVGQLGVSAECGRRSAVNVVAAKFHGEMVVGVGHLVDGGVHGIILHGKVGRRAVGEVCP